MINSRKYGSFSYLSNVFTHNFLLNNEIVCWKTYCVNLVVFDKNVHKVVMFFLIAEVRKVNLLMEIIRLMLYVAYLQNKVIYYFSGKTAFTRKKCIFKNPHKKR